MKRIVNTLLWSLLLAVGVPMGNAHANPNTTDSSGAVKSAKAKKKAHAGGQIRFLPGSAETARDRSNRLKRECKGQVNAGACSGYTT